MEINLRLTKERLSYQNNKKSRSNVIITRKIGRKRENQVAILKKQLLLFKPQEMQIEISRKNFCCFKITRKSNQELKTTTFDVLKSKENQALISRKPLLFCQNPKRKF